MFPRINRRQLPDTLLKTALPLVAWLCLSLAGCTAPQWKESFAKPDWQVSGKIGVRESAFKATSGLFQWSQLGDDYIIHLYSGLGQLQFTLYGSRDFARIERADGQIQTARSAQTLLMNLTGWSFPIESTYQWLSGSTHSNESNPVYDAQGHLSAFDTNDWHIALSRYQSHGDDELPSRIRLTNDDLTVTIIIKEYVHTSQP